MIDLRSDTVTKPTPEMLEYMTKAIVGDDVYQEDATVNEFQQKIAKMFGMQAGLFVPSGTMSNQLGVKVLTQPGDEILIEEMGHIFNFETAAAGFLSGVQISTVKGKSGKLEIDLLKDKIRGKYDWEPNTKVICIENTTNKGGGACYTKEELLKIKEFADQNQLSLHLDGARIWNAIAETGIEASFFGKIADTISVCFSKALGAPIGSMLLSSEKNIAKARRFRKMWGGGMRQVGILAAAADYAVDNHQKLLEDDHKRAKLLAEHINKSENLSINMDAAETNILVFDVLCCSAEEALEKFKRHGILLSQFGKNTLRATFHFQIGDDDLEKVIQAIKMEF